MNKKYTLKHTPQNHNEDNTPTRNLMHTKNILNQQNKHLKSVQKNKEFKTKQHRYLKNQDTSKNLYIQYSTFCFLHSSYLSSFMQPINTQTDVCTHPHTYYEINTERTIELRHT